MNQLESFGGQQAVAHASTTGNSRGPGKTVQSGIFTQTSHFPGLFYFPQPVFRCLDASLVAFFHNGKVRRQVGVPSPDISPPPANLPGWDA